MTSIFACIVCDLMHSYMHNESSNVSIHPPDTYPDFNHMQTGDVTLPSRVLITYTMSHHMHPSMHSDTHPDLRYKYSHAGW